MSLVSSACRKLSAVSIVTAKIAIPFPRVHQSAIHNLQSEMPLRALPPASNRVTAGPLSAYGSRLAAPIPAMDDGRTVGQGPRRPRTMRCQTEAAGANDPRRVGNRSRIPTHSPRHPDSHRLSIPGHLDLRGRTASASLDAAPASNIVPMGLEK